MRRRPPSQALASVLALLLLLLALVVVPADGFVAVRSAGAAMQVRLKCGCWGSLWFVSLAHLPTVIYMHACT